ncbi:MAG: hypothetical protein ACR2QB_08310 [Gammaproteobacteria bacterium]
MTDSSQTEFTGQARGRPPVGVVEVLIANCRPQPAIPALLMLFITLTMATFSADPSPVPGAEHGPISLLIPVGLLISCALAVAAGFCSFAPLVGWIVVAAWGLRFTQSGALPAYNRYVLLAGIGIAVIMMVVQAWRVATGRFQPTIRDARE